MSVLATNSLLLTVKKFLLWGPRCSSSEFLDESSVVERTALYGLMGVFVVGIGDKNLLRATHHSVAVCRNSINALQAV